MTAATMTDDQRRELLYATVHDLWPDGDVIDMLFAAALALIPTGKVAVVRDIEPGDLVDAIFGGDD